MKINIRRLKTSLKSKLTSLVSKEGTAPKSQKPIRQRKRGKMVAQKRTGAGSIMRATSASATKPQSLAPETVGGIVPTTEQAIDMGLSVKWAPWNVGASKPEEQGAYFAWGEINASKESYDWGTYFWITEGKCNWVNISKYQIADGQTSGDWYNDLGLFIGDGKSNLESVDDAATANWGGGRRMPTTAEFEELMDENNCWWRWVTNYKNSGLAGYEIKSKKTGGLLFFPAAGDHWRSELYNGGIYGFYWSSVLDCGGSDYARCLSFDSNEYYTDYDSRNCGFSVRAVATSAE